MEIEAPFTYTWTIDNFISYGQTMLPKPKKISGYYQFFSDAILESPKFVTENGKRKWRLELKVQDISFKLGRMEPNSHFSLYLQAEKLKQSELRVALKCSIVNDEGKNTNTMGRFAK